MLRSALASSWPGRFLSMVIFLFAAVASPAGADDSGGRNDWSQRQLQEMLRDGNPRHSVPSTPPREPELLFSQEILDISCLGEPNEICQMSRRLLQQFQQLRAAEEEVSNLKSRNEKLQKAVAGLEARVDELLKANGRFLRMANDRERENRDLRRDLGRMQDKLASRDKKIERLTNQLETLRAETRSGSPNPREPANLSISCVEVRNLGFAAGSRRFVQVELVNSCGRCVDIQAAHYRNGSPVNFAGWFRNVPPREAKYVRYDASLSGRHEYRVTQVVPCS